MMEMTEEMAKQEKSLKRKIQGNMRNFNFCVRQ